MPAKFAEPESFAEVSLLTVNRTQIAKISLITGISSLSSEKLVRDLAIPLDSVGVFADSCCITPVPPLPLVGEVQLGWVFLCPDGSFDRRWGRCHR